MMTCLDPKRMVVVLEPVTEAIDAPHGLKVMSVVEDIWSGNAKIGSEKIPKDADK